MQLNQRERNTVLAALRRHQYHLEGTTPDAEHERLLQEIASNHGADEPLTVREIDQLCAVINDGRRRARFYLRFRGDTWRLTFSHYLGSNQVAILLARSDDPSDVLRATTNVPEWGLAEGEVLIKDYSENEGVLAALTAAGVVADTGRTCPAGLASATICRLLVNPDWYRDEPKM